MAAEIIDTVFSSKPVGNFQPSTHLQPICSELQPILVEIRRHLRMNPEVGFKEFETSRYIKAVLSSQGFSPVSIAKTGVYVDIHGDHPGPMVAYRADIDALPSQDEIVTSYSSTKPGVGHLCGHDAHTSIGIGVALILNRLKGYMHGSVRVFFQPNEEGMPSGAPELIKEGILDNVQAAYAIHVDPSVDSGKFGLISGAATAAADRFDVIVDAKTTGHSARPHNTVDTVWVATQIANLLYQLSGRIADPRHPSILTICKFEAGRAYNVIPSSATFGGTLRSTEHGVRKQLKERLINVATEIGLLSGVEVRVEYHDGAPPVMNDPNTIKAIGEKIAEIFSKDKIHNIDLPSMGAEDFAHYLVHVPGAMIRVGTHHSEHTSYPLHDANFDIDETVLSPTAYLMSNVLLQFLERSRDSIS